MSDDKSTYCGGINITMNMVVFMKLTEISGFAQIPGFTENPSADISISEINCLRDILHEITFNLFINFRKHYYFIVKIINNYDCHAKCL